MNWRVAAGTYSAAMEACLSSIGVALLPMGPAMRHLKTGKLMQLLEDFLLPEVSINLVYSSVKHQSAAARALHAALVELKVR